MKCGASVCASLNFPAVIIFGQYMYGNSSHHQITRAPLKIVFFARESLSQSDASNTIYYKIRVPLLQNPEVHSELPNLLTLRLEIVRYSKGKKEVQGMYEAINYRRIKESTP